MSQIVVGKMPGRARVWPALLLPLLAVASSALPAQADAHAEARAHAMAGRTDRAVSLYDSLRAIAPSDREAALGAATALAWGKRYADAERRYHDLLAHWPNDLEAAQGLARLMAWRGELAASESQWRALTARDGTNPDHWLGLAQVLRWQERRSEARSALQRAQALAPAHAEVRAERRRLATEFASSIEPTIRQSRDSEGNSNWSATVGAVLPTSRGHLWRVAAVERAAGLGARAGRARGIETAAEFVFGDQGAVLLEAGALQLADAQQAARLMPSGRLRGRWTPGGRWRVDGSAGRTVLDETAPLIANAIVMDGVGLATQLRVRTVWRFSLSGTMATLRGGEAPNQRGEWEAALTAVPHGSLALGGRVRQVRHARLATDGYFSPRRHDLAEATLRWEPGQSVGWGARLEGALGVQQLLLTGPAERGPAQRLFMGVARRWELGGQLQLGYEYTSVAGIAPLGTTANVTYRRHGVVASGRLPLMR